MAWYEKHITLKSRVPKWVWKFLGPKVNWKTIDMEIRKWKKHAQP